MALLDENKPYVVIESKTQSNSINSRCPILVDEEVKHYSRLGYTTKAETLSLILNNQTFRSSSLNAAKLNDQMEKNRVDLEELAGSRFITCFTHICHESVPFWCCYGAQNKEKKVQLQFRNFAENIEELIYCDYALIQNDKKLFFNGAEYGKAVNQNGIPGAILGLPKTYNDYELKSVIKGIQLFDIDYVSVDSDIFNRSNKQMVNLKLGTDDNAGSITCEAYDASNLGKQKSNPWDYEMETRLMIITSSACDCIGDWIDIRLKPEIFRDMEIIMSPWDIGNLESEIQAIIDNCDLPDEIKNSIVIRESSLKGTLNLNL